MADILNMSEDIYNLLISYGFEKKSDFLFEAVNDTYDYLYKILITGGRYYELTYENANKSNRSFNQLVFQGFEVKNAAELGFLLNSNVLLKPLLRFLR